MNRRNLDKQRIFSKIDEMENYLSELGEIDLVDFEDYSKSVEKKRASERLLQITVEAVLDVCNLIVSGLKLGIPSDEEEVFEKLEKRKIISKKVKNILNDMKGFRNILVHKYGTLDDEIVFEILNERLEDFERFKKEILGFLKKEKA